MDRATKRRWLPFVILALANLGIAAYVMQRPLRTYPPAITEVRADLPDPGRVAGCEVRVLCLGESTTCYSRAYNDFSYPALLEQTLRAQLPEHSCGVYNAGIPLGNSHLELQALEPLLTSVRPQVVIVMMGANDFGSVAPLSSLDNGEVIAGAPVYEEFGYLSDARATEPGFGRPRGDSTPQGAPPPATSPTLSDPQRKAIESAHRYHDYNAFPWAADAYDEAIRLAPWLHELELEQVEMLLRSPYRDDPRVRQRLAHLASLHPGSARVLLDLTLERWLTGHSSECKALWSRASQVPWSDVSYQSDNLLMGISLLQQSYNDPAYCKHLEEAVASHPHDLRLYCYLAAEHDRLGHAAERQRYFELAERRRRELACVTTARGYRDLRLRLAKAGIAMVCNQYPGRSGEPLRRMVGAHPGVWFVDTERELAQARRSHPMGDIFLDLCYGDFGHGTQLTNQVVATRIAQVIVSQKLWQQPASSPRL